MRTSIYTITVGLVFRGNVPVQAFKAYGGVEMALHSFLTSALDEAEW